MQRIGRERLPIQLSRVHNHSWLDLDKPVRVQCTQIPQGRHMSKKQLELGRKLANEIYDWDLRRLMTISAEEKAYLQSSYPDLTPAQIDDLVKQVQEAREIEVQRIGWLALPHDLTVVITIILTAIFGWKVGVVGYVAALVLFESIAQFTFSAAIYKPLSFLVWLTYPGYLLFAYSLYRQGFPIWQVILATLFLWAGTFLLGTLARLPSRLILKNLQKSREEFEQRTPRSSGSK